MDSSQSPTLIDIDAVIGLERIEDPRGDNEEYTIAVVERMTDADGGNAIARFERGSSGIWGLGIDTVGDFEKRYPLLTFSPLVDRSSKFDHICRQDLAGRGQLYRRTRHESVVFRLHVSGRRTALGGCTT